MTFSDTMTTEYWGVPLWGWIVLVAGLVLIIAVAKGAMGKKKEEGDEVKKSEGDVEAGNAKMPEGEPVTSPTPDAAQEFPRDGSLPPPAPSETSHKG